MKTTCEYTDKEFTIVTIYNMDTRTWPFLGPDGVELAVVTACVVERNELFYTFDELLLGRLIPPRDYVRWLYEKALEVNPHIEEIVNQWENSGRNPKNYSAKSPKTSPKTSTPPPGP